MFLTFINEILLRITFMMVIEVQKLSFLKLLLFKKENENVHSVCTEKIRSNRYLNVNSSHHLAQLSRIINTLICRSERLTDNDYKIEERKQLIDAFVMKRFNKKATNENSVTWRQFLNINRNKNYLC